MSKTCICCGEPSTKLCDYIFGFQIERTLPHPTMNADGMWTCDAPLCDKHAHRAGSIFRCGIPQFHVDCPCSGHDTIDYCPLHKDSKRDAQPMFEADAEYLRQKAHVELRRSMIALHK